MKFSILLNLYFQNKAEYLSKGSKRWLLLSVCFVLKQCQCLNHLLPKILRLMTCFLSCLRLNSEAVTLLNVLFSKHQLHGLFLWGDPLDIQSALLINLCHNCPKHFDLQVEETPRVLEAIKPKRYIVSVRDEELNQQHLLIQVFVSVKVYFLRLTEQPWKRTCTTTLKTLGRRRKQQLKLFPKLTATNIQP